MGMKVVAKLDHRLINIVEKPRKIVGESGGHRGIVPRRPMGSRGSFDYDGRSATTRL
jgi:hypothetical protein